MKSYKDLAPYQQRVVAELSEASCRLHSLNAFVESDEFDSVPIPEQMRLARQHFLMALLVQCLNERVSAFME